MNPTPAGWYPDPGGSGTERYWDGKRWKGEREVDTKTATVSYVKLDPSSTVLIVAFGMVVGWFLIWLGAQVAPDIFYWPIKVVVNELPPFGR